MTVISVVIGSLGTFSEGLEIGLEKLEIGGRMETILTITLLWSVRILSSIPEVIWRLAVTQTLVKWPPDNYWLEELISSQIIIIKKPALFKSGQWHFHQDNAPVHNSILVTDDLTKMGIKTVHHRPYSQDLGPCDFCLFPKIGACRYETF